MRRILALAVAAITIVAAFMAFGCGPSITIVSVDSALVIIDYQKSVRESAKEARVTINDVIVSTEVQLHQPPYEERYLYTVALSKEVRGTRAAKILRVAGFEPGNLMELIAFHNDAGRSKCKQEIVALDSAAFYIYGGERTYTTVPCLERGTIGYFNIYSDWFTEHRFLARR